MIPKAKAGIYSKSISGSDLKGDLYMKEQELVYLEDGQPVTDSLKIAEVFGKQHDNVTRDIRSLNCSKEFLHANFKESEYVNNRGRTYPKYTITEAGFLYLAMGYNGEKAARIKEQYIREFSVSDVITGIDGKAKDIIFSNRERAQIENMVYLENGHPVTDSLMVAEAFGKRHADVLRSIDNLESSKEFNERNFALGDYMDAKGEKRRKYVITRDGFAILAMGYTGKEAMQFKERYIQEFNQISKELQEMKDGVQLMNPKSALELPIKAEQPEVIPLYDLNQPWDFKANPQYVSAVLQFPTKDILLQAVGDIGAIEHEQMVELFGVQQKHIHSMISRGELILHELWLGNRKQVIYTLGLYGSKKVGRKPARIEHWSAEDVLEKLVFFAFVKDLQSKEPYPVLAIQADESPFVGRISDSGMVYKVMVVQQPISRYELPKDEGEAIYILTAKEEYAQPLQQKYERAIPYAYIAFMASTPKHPSKADPFAFLNDLP
ncbi:Phage regulatory protein Rha [compost metagenome]